MKKTYEKSESTEKMITFDEGTSKVDYLIWYVGITLTIGLAIAIIAFSLWIVVK